MASRNRGKQNKIHALDTNVLMHDPASLFRFQEHDIFIPSQVLSELDKHKIGMSEPQRNARKVSRNMRHLAASWVLKGKKLAVGIPLNLIDEGKGATGKLFFEIPDLDPNHPDDRIIIAAKKLAEQTGAKQKVVLVTKDNLAYLKAIAAGLDCEDYLTDAVEDDGFDVGITILSEIPSVVTCTKSDQGNHYVVEDDERLRPGGCLLVDGDEDAPFRAFVGARSRGRIELREARSYFNGTKVFGINARSEEQNFAFAALMNPEVSCVLLTGPAGTGKTLAALAAGLEQTGKGKDYSEIIITRATVPLGEEIGFLPGTEEEKMGAWMGAFTDNLEVLCETSSEGGEWGRGASMEMLRNQIKVKSMSFMRGRTFQQRFLIIDEAQNLTTKQMKALITRVGKGSKIVLMGNLAQIDTPYLTENTSGLAYIAERVHKTAPPFIAHIGLVKGERHELTDWVNDNC